MATGIIKLSSLSATADAIRSKIQNESKIYPKDMANAISLIDTIELNSQEVSSNERKIILSPDSEHNAISKVTAIATTKGLCSYGEGSKLSIDKFIMPQTFDGHYFISYDKGDYAIMGGRRITRVYQSGIPLLMGLAKRSDGYICATFASGTDLGVVGNVITGTYTEKLTARFHDGSAMYLYGGFNGSYKSYDVDLYHSSGALATKVKYASPPLILPFPNNPMEIVCSNELETEFIENIIRKCGASE